MIVKSKRAFTLIELIVVIAIIGILAGIAIPVYSHLVSGRTEKMLEEKATTIYSIAEQLNSNILYGQVQVSQYGDVSDEAIGIEIKNALNNILNPNSQVDSVLTVTQWNELSATEANEGIYIQVTVTSDVREVTAICILEDETKVRYAG